MFKWISQFVLMGILFTVTFFKVHDIIRNFIVVFIFNAMLGIFNIVTKKFLFDQFSLFFLVILTLSTEVTNSHTDSCESLDDWSW